VSYTDKGNSFVSEKPKIWLATLGNAISFDLAPDGKRVLVVTPAGGAATRAEHTVVFMQNFHDELRRRVPVEK
jgi:hypothetical protein